MANGQAALDVDHEHGEDQLQGELAATDVARLMHPTHGEFRHPSFHGLASVVGKRTLRCGSGPGVAVAGNGYRRPGMPGPLVPEMVPDFRRL